MLKLSGGLRVLLADDHKAISERVKGLLESDFRGRWRSGQRAGSGDNAGELNPDVAVVDIEMPVLDGLEAIRQIKK
jgi:CheY-like chemotaxis protein